MNRRFGGYDSGQAEGSNTLPSHNTFLKNLNCPVIRFEKEMTTEEQVEFICNKLNYKVYTQDRL